MFKITRFGYTWRCRFFLLENDKLVTPGQSHGLTCYLPHWEGLNLCPVAFKDLRSLFDKAFSQKRRYWVNMGLKHRQLALMFTDIVGYSRLMSQNEAQTIELLEEYRRILLLHIEENCGTVIEFIGDAVFARFDNAEDAVSAGLAVQKNLITFNVRSPAEWPKLQSRIGIHLGEVALKEDALFGDDVNIAARLEPIAVADGLCVSEKVYDAVKDKISEPVLSLGTQRLKNIEDTIRCYLIRPSGISLATQFHYFSRKCQQKLAAYRYSVAMAALLVVCLAVYFVPRWLVPGYTANYVEIADFRNLMSDDGAPDYFSAGITEALRAQLADVRDVYILEAGKGVRGPIRLEGSVQRVSNSIRIAYRLFRRKDNVQIAGGKLDGAYDDIFILQDRVVAEIAGYLAEEFNLQNFRPAALKITEDVTAYDYYLKGLQYLRMPQSHTHYDEAIKHFTTALVHDDDFALANAGLCSAYRGKFVITFSASLANTAEKYCELALAQDDSLFQVYEALGAIYRDTGRGDEAIVLLTNALRLDNINSRALIELAKAYNKQNALRMAEDFYIQAIDAYPDYWTAYQAYATFLVRQGRHLKAIEYFKKSLDITPENSVSLSNLAVAYVYLGDFRKAAQALDKSFAISPSSWSFSNTGTIHYFAENYERSAQMFEEAIRLSPDDYRLYANLADALRHIPKRADEAADHYQKSIRVALKAMEVNSKDASVHQYLALSYLFLGEKERSLYHLQKATEFSPNDIDVLYARVKHQVISGEIDKAIASLERLIEAGYSQSLIEADPDLRALVQLNEYKEFVANIDGR